ncbi:MAG: methyl-accepting chemotaxis protein [Candidatus Omnitrophica bacterium]|nr:methyl-accepting chemotaxis protein [Candidatus Omnitrophota bacterium]
MLKFLPKNLEFKIIFSVGIALFVVLGISAVINISTQSRILIEQEKSLASILSDSILNGIFYPMLGGDQALVQTVFNYFASQKQIDMLFLANNEGEIKRCTSNEYFGKKIDFRGIISEIESKDKSTKLQKFKTSSRNPNKKVFATYIPVYNNPECNSCHGKNTKILGLLGVELEWDNVKKATADTLNRVLLIALISIFLISILVIILLRKLVIKPINILVKASEPAVRGDLTITVDNNSEDEIGKLTVAYNAIIKNLHNMVSRIKELAGKVSSFAQEISTSSKEMNASTQEISSTIQKIAKGVTTQAKRVEDTSQLMEGLSDSVRRVADNATSATKSSEKSLEQAQSGGYATAEAVEKMNKITTTVSNAAAVISSLGEKSQQIGQITETITNIADQTNLLALNAAIEAARAGDAGRGFAVVAEEVRKLAEGSAEAARRIGSLIKGIQVETPKAVSSIEAGTKEVAEGALIVSRVSDALAEIINAVRTSATMVDEITEATQHQLAASEKIVKAVDEVAVVAEESASATEEASSSAEEQTASMEELTASAEELARLALDLQELVDKFQLNKK